MDKIEVILPLIVNSRSIVLRILIWGGVLFVCIAFINFIRGEGGGLVSIVFLFIGILMLNANYVIKEYSVIGTICLLPDKITVSNENGLNNYPIVNLDQLEIFLLEIKGEFYGGKAITTKTGVRNFIKFRYQGEVKEMMFLLEDQWTFQLSQIIQFWQRSNIDVVLHNQTRKQFV
ncbi:hypothetical protein [Chitinophaga ginsengisegetis]|uniref:hypothetical protein n=1 Tax=Chitinophaga ginsengisegetis TaxID=393003 RepID=UPI000DB8FFA1|nr:hypothetical protein [Chitinophaga ginsengisegetis]MDR6571317.1 hypothetical protein [Chitinophaga ginsengisegetis]MDR6651051.1 hypothetical protein [Chitinophaga ginsengisegetis]MDR6657401.1 hypothetical protein [Chitinophaga ginsengisegetis]